MSEHDAEKRELVAKLVVELLGEPAADLLLDAMLVHADTGLMPRALRAQRDELRDACDEALNALLCSIPAGGADDRKTIADAKAKLRAALAKVSK